jgi:hypothetical protein
VLVHFFRFAPTAIEQDCARASWAADPCPLLPFCYPIRRDAIEEAGTAARLWVRFRPENID